ncbi:putative abnormal spindle-like microcephaly-associated protein [Plasmopara halstedii]
MNHEERKALAEAGRVTNLRAMFSKGAATNAEPPAWKRQNASKISSRNKVEKSGESANTLQPRTADRHLEKRSDNAYNHAMRQEMYVRAVEQKVIKSLSKLASDEKAFKDEKCEEQHCRDAIDHKEQHLTTVSAKATLSSDHDQSQKSHLSQRVNSTSAEQETRITDRNDACRNTTAEEQVDEKKRTRKLERQQEPSTKDAYNMNKHTSTDLDPVYVHAKTVAQLEKEAEEKARAALLKCDQHDVSHKRSMKNGMMVSKSANGSGTPNGLVCFWAIVQLLDLSTVFLCLLVKRYPFTDPAARVKKPSPQSLKALARFQEQLAVSRKESERKLSMDSVESLDLGRKQSFDELDLDQIKASVDGAKIDMRSTAQKFAEMDRKAVELAKQNKKPLKFYGVAYQHDGKVFRTKEQERKAARLKNDMAGRIQARVRGGMARKLYSERLKSAGRIAICIQTEFRRIQAQKQVEHLRIRLQREKACAVVIQKVVRGHVIRSRYLTQVAAAILLQSHTRRRQAQAFYTRQLIATNKIQTFIIKMLAGQKARKEVAWFRKKRDAAVVIQSVYRTKAAKMRAKIRLQAAVRVQCVWRQFLAKSTIRLLQIEAQEIIRQENLARQRVAEEQDRADEQTRLEEQARFQELKL